MTMTVLCGRKPEYSDRFERRALSTETREGYVRSSWRLSGVGSRMIVRKIGLASMALCGQLSLARVPQDITHGG